MPYCKTMRTMKSNLSSAHGSVPCFFVPCCFPYFVVACAAAWGVSAHAQDRIYPKRDTVASGKIIELTPTTVKVTVRGKDQAYEMSDVRKISFDGEPNTLDRARESVLQGEYEQALDEVKKIPLDSLTNPLVKQDVAFYRHYCEGRLALAGSGDKGAAANGLIAIVRDNPKTHHLYEISDLLGELEMSAGRPEQAVRYFNVLTTAKSADTKALGDYRLAEVQLSQGKHSEAKVLFQKLITTQSTSPEMVRLKYLAEVGMAVSDNLAGNSQEALNKLDALAQQLDSTDQPLFARINNARGACYVALGKTNQALLSYLQTDLLFFTDGETHAEALYHLAQLWPKAGQPARAAEAKSRLSSLYASSTWANK
jgi:tetratricopeptide (TPR) repeat protein